MEQINNEISLEEALSLIIVRDGVVHTYMNPAEGVMLGSDCGLQQLTEKMKASETIRIAGEQAQRYKHAIVITTEIGYWFIENDPVKLQEFMQRTGKHG